ncbi:hypothetical protein MRX96_042272 [Rhipicephalus microplus]
MPCARWSPFAGSHAYMYALLCSAFPFRRRYIRRDVRHHCLASGLPVHAVAEVMRHWHLIRENVLLGAEASGGLNRDDLSGNVDWRVPHGINNSHRRRPVSQPEGVVIVAEEHATTPEWPLKDTPRDHFFGLLLYPVRSSVRVCKKGYRAVAIAKTAQLMLKVRKLRQR